MRTFDEFKESRLRMDPAAAKMNDTQWEHAYVAYRRTREKPVPPPEGSEAEKPGKKGSSPSRPRKSRRRPGGLSSLRGRIRGQSAYGDLRAAVGVLFWIALGAVVVDGIAGFSIEAMGAGSVASLKMIQAVLVTILLGAVVLIFRLLATVVIDIADVALHRVQGEKEAKGREPEKPASGNRSGEASGPTR